MRISFIAAVCALCLLSIQPANSSSSSSVTGRILRTQQSLQLITDLGALTLQGERSIESQLAGLETGDLATVFGQTFDLDRNGSPDWIRVTSIGQVGLKRILGHWLGDGFGFISFESHTRMSGLKPGGRFQLRYTLTPLSQGTFSLILFEDSSLSRTPAIDSEPLKQIVNWILPERTRPKGDRIQLGQLDVREDETLKIQFFPSTSQSEYNPFQVKLVPFGTR